MAIPRIFVSSTCYDLQEIRFQLRNFIKEFGYDSVMSEFDDIFYNYSIHVQDSCLEEISKCQLFLLVVGNNYGSFYHQDKQHDKIPDSVTLREFRKALEIKIYKHIFINKYVDYDYKNYKRALDKKVLKYFQENDVADDKIGEVRRKLKEEFDSIYHFPYDSYKYVFYFLDIIHDLQEGNAINTFESFADIKESLRKQWAGFMYESLIKKDKVEASFIQPLEKKIDQLEKNISKLLETKTIDKDSKVTFDISILSREANIENLEKLQNKIEALLTDVCTHETGNYDNYGDEVLAQRVYFDRKFDYNTTKKWLDYLKELVQSFKWSKYIHVENVFKNFSLSKFNKWYEEISYKTIFELFSMYNSLSLEDQKLFINTVTQKLNKYYENPTPVKEEVVNELPF